MPRPTVDLLLVEEKLAELRKEYRAYPAKRSIIIRQARVYQNIKEKLLNRQS